MKEVDASIEQDSAFDFNQAFDKSYRSIQASLARSEHYYPRFLAEDNTTGRSWVHIDDKLVAIADVRLAHAYEIDNFKS